jgi:hypothetical protein
MEVRITSDQSVQEHRFAFAIIKATYYHCHPVRAVVERLSITLYLKVHNGSVTPSESVHYNSKSTPK